MPTNTSDRDQLIDLEARAWQLRQAGWTQARIALELGRDQGTISRVLARVYRRALARLDKHAARHRAVQVELLERIVDESLQAWERSKRPKKRSAKRSGGSGKGAGDVLSQEATERDGDPSFLAAAMSALDRIRKLLNLDVTPVVEKEETGTVADLRAALLEAEEADAAFESDPENQEPTACDPPD